MEPARCDGKTCGTSYKNCGNKKLCIHNNLEILYPKISKQWNYELNKGTPRDYLPGSCVKAWWVCENVNCGCKTWQTNIQSRTRTSKDTGCYCCSGCFCPHNNLTTTHPKMLDEWDYTRNDKLPSEYTYGSHAIVFWKCLNSNCGCHNYEMVIKDKIFRESECPFCSRYGQRPCKHYNAEICIPNLSEEWDYVKNINPPSHYLPSSNVEVFLICTKNKSHQWKTNIQNRKRGRVNCPDCKNIERQNYNLLTEFSVVCKEWDYDVNDFLPESYAPHSNKYAWWSCKNNNLHKWKTRIGHRTKDNPTGCPFCNSSRLSDEHNLAVYNSELSSEWDYNKNDTVPSAHTPYSGDKVWWKCKKNLEHSWESTIANRSYGNNCPKCSTHGYSKMQIEWLNYVSEQEHINIIHAENGGEYHVQNVGKVDGYCKENNTVYEFHGDFYHGNPIKYNSSDINPKTYKSYGELYDKTLKRNELIISKSYKLVTMWEYEFLKLRKQIKIINEQKLRTINYNNLELNPIRKIKLRIIEKTNVNVEVKQIKHPKLIIINSTK